MKKLNKVVLISGCLTAVILLAGCTQQQGAPIINADQTMVEANAAAVVANSVHSQQTKAMPQYYTVKRGDTLGSIAAKFGTSYQHLAQLNQIAAPYTIYVGERLVISENGDVVASASSTSASATVPSSHHTVRADHGSRLVQGNRWTWPASGHVVTNAKHELMFSTAAGQSVKAAANGQVLYAGMTSSHNPAKMILVQHKNGFVTSYANVDHIDVQAGQNVKRGQKLAVTTQQSFVFAVRHHGQIVNAANYLPAH